MLIRTRSREMRLFFKINSNKIKMTHLVKNQSSLNSILELILSMIGKRINGTLKILTWGFTKMSCVILTTRNLRYEYKIKTTLKLILLFRSRNSIGKGTSRGHGLQLINKRPLLEIYNRRQHFQILLILTLKSIHKVKNSAETQVPIRKTKEPW